MRQWLTRATERRTHDTPRAQAADGDKLRKEPLDRFLRDRAALSRARQQPDEPLPPCNQAGHAAGNHIYQIADTNCTICSHRRLWLRAHVERQMSASAAVARRAWDQRKGGLACAWRLSELGAVCRVRNHHAYRRSGSPSADFSARFYGRYRFRSNALRVSHAVWMGTRSRRVSVSPSNRHGHAASEPAVVCACAKRQSGHRDGEKSTSFWTP